MNSIDERREQVKILVEEGNSNQEIAKKLGVKIDRIAKDIVYLRRKGELSKERNTKTL